MMMTISPETWEIYTGVVDSLKEKYAELWASVQDGKPRGDDEAWNIRFQLQEAERLVRLAEAKEEKAQEERRAANETLAQAVEDRAAAEEERAAADDEWERAQAQLAKAQAEWDKAQEEWAEMRRERETLRADREAAKGERERAAKERVDARKAEAAAKRRLEEAAALEEESRRQRECADARHHEVGEMLRAVQTEREQIEQALRAGKEEAALRKAKQDAERFRVKEELAAKAEELARERMAAAEEEARLVVARAQEEARLVLEGARRRAEAQAKRTKQDLSKAREILEKERAEAKKAVEEMRESHRRIAPTTRRFLADCEKHQAACEERAGFLARQVETFRALARQHVQRVVSAIGGVQLLAVEVTRIVEECQLTEMAMAAEGGSSGSSAGSSSPLVVAGEERRSAEVTMSDERAANEFLSEVDRLKAALIHERRKTLVASGALDRIRHVHANEAKSLRAELKDMHARYENSCFAAVNLAQALQENLCTCCEKKREQPPAGVSMMVIDDEHSHKDLVFALCRPGFSGQKKQLDDLDLEEMRDLLRCCATTMGTDKKEMARIEEERKQLEREKEALKERLKQCHELLCVSYNTVHGLQLVYEDMPREVQHMVVKMQLGSHVQLEAVLKFLESASDDIDNGRALVQVLQEEGAEGFDTEESRAVLSNFSSTCRGVHRFLRGLFDSPDCSSQIGLMAFEVLDSIIHMPEDKVQDAENAAGFMPGTDKMCAFMCKLEEWRCELWQKGKADMGGRMPGGEFKWGGEYDAKWISRLQSMGVGMVYNCDDAKAAGQGADGSEGARKKKKGASGRVKGGRA